MSTAAEGDAWMLSLDTLHVNKSGTGSTGAGDPANIVTLKEVVVFAVKELDI